jgi:hypothetical protein
MVVRRSISFTEESLKVIKQRREKNSTETEIPDFSQAAIWSIALFITLFFTLHALGNS